MQYRFLSAALILCTLATALDAGPRRSRGGGCPGGNCSNGSCFAGECNTPDCCAAQQPAKVASATQWRTHPDRPDEIYLYQGNLQLGGWSYSRQVWRSYKPACDCWGPEEPSPPVNPPTRIGAPAKKLMPLADDEDELVPVSKPVAEDLAHPQNFGVAWDKISDHQATFNGRKIGCEKAIEMIGKQVPDDTNNFRLTIIGTEAQQKTALDQFATLDDPLRSRINPWTVPPDHWSLKDLTTDQPVFVTTGSPTIYLQAPTGQVLHRQDDAADVIGAIRTAVKKYDSAKDPDARKPAPTPTPEPTPSTNPVIPIGTVIPAGVLALAGGLWFFGRKK